MLKKICLLLLSTLITQELSAQEIHYSDTTPVEEFRLPLQHAMGGSVEDIYDEIEYIPLETSKESTIQRIKKMWLSDQYYIVFDDFGGQIVFFDKQGKYIRKINEVPNCKTCKVDNLLFEDVSVDLGSGFIYAKTIIPVKDDHRWVKYDFEGNYFGDQPQLHDMSEFFIWKNALFLYNSPRGLQEERNFNMLSVLNNDQEKSIIIYDSLASINSSEYKDNNRTFSDASKQDSVLYFTRPYDYNIYELNKQGLQKVYQFILPLQYSIPSDFISNKEYDGKRDKLLKEENQDWIIKIDNIRRHRDYFIFNANTSTVFSKFAYNTSTGFLLNLEKVTPSNFNNNFSLGEDWNDFIIASDDQYLYKSVMSSELLKTTQEAGFNYTNDPNGKVRKMINDLTHLSNPILVRLKIKVDL